MNTVQGFQNRAIQWNKLKRNEFLELRKSVVNTFDVDGRSAQTHLGQRGTRTKSEIRNRSERPN